MPNATVSKPYNTNCPGTGCTWPDEAAAEVHLKKTAEVIHSLDADILTLEEVEDCFVLQHLAEEVNKLFPEAHHYRPYLKRGTDTATGQNAALLTRVDPDVDLERTADRATYPIHGSECGYNGTGTYGVSKHYYTHFTINGARVGLIGAHFLAFPLQKVISLFAFALSFYSVPPSLTCHRRTGVQSARHRPQCSVKSWKRHCRRRWTR